MVKNLTALISGATIGDLAGLEELIGILVKDNDIDKNCYQVMWQVFTKVMPDTTDEESQSALVLLGMVIFSISLGLNQNKVMGQGCNVPLWGIKKVTYV